MNRNDFKLILKLLVAIMVGIALGLFLSNYNTDSYFNAHSIIQIIGSIKYILGQIIFFTVPLVIVGFITPSITKLGHNANKMLTSAVVISYLSSLGACLFAVFIGYNIIPKLTINPASEQLKIISPLLFKLDIPMIMPVMSALVLSLILGIAILATSSEITSKIMDEFGNMVLFIVKKIIIPLLPFFIICTFAELAYKGNLTVQLKLFIKIIALAILCHFIWLIFLYGIAGLISRRSPFKVFKFYGPAYLTAVGTMSSAATLPIAIECARKSPVLSRNTVDFIIPIGATIHLCGSALTETLFCIGIYYLFMGALPPLSLIFLFVVLLAVFAVGAPGVPGGTVMASLGIVQSILGFDAEMIGVLLAIFALQDSFGTACNITGDGAIALIIDGIFNPKAENLQNINLKV